MSEREPIDVPIKPDVFWEGDFRRPEARLAGARCRRCDEGFFPPRRVCPRCHDAASIVAEPLATRGRVFAMTHVTRPADQYAGPYLLALIDLADGVRVMAQLKAAPDAARLGDEVTLVVEPMFEMDGQRVWGYRFAPVPTR